MLEHLERDIKDELFENPGYTPLQVCYPVKEQIERHVDRSII